MDQGIPAFLEDIQRWMSVWLYDYSCDHEISLVSAASSIVLSLVVAKLAVSKVLEFLLAVTRRQHPHVKETSATDDKSASLVSSSLSSSSWSRYQVVSCSVLLLLAWIELPFVLLSTPYKEGGLADLLQGTDPKLNEILARVPAIQKGPSTPLFFWNRHIQFIPWLIQNEIHRQEGIPFQRIHVEVSDCLNKVDDDCSRQQQATTMHDTVTLDIFPPFDDDDDDTNDDYYSSYSKNNFNRSSPIILFAPGLRCYSQDMPGNSIIRRAYGKGIRSIVVNRRGHTPNQPLKSPRWNLFGDVDDMEQVYWYIKEQLVGMEDTPFFLHGVSSGTAVTVSALSKWDKRRSDSERSNNSTQQQQQPSRIPAFVASVDNSPGYDISKVLDRDRFLWPYNDILMIGVKDHFVVQNEQILRAHDSDAVDRMLAASSLQEFVDAGVHFAGYDNTTLYYQDTNPINEVRDITTPKFVLNAVDDPCCNINNLYEASPYPQHDGKTFAQMIRETERGMVAVARTGSHCPYLCTRNGWLPFVRDPLSGGWMLNSWADEVTIDYFLAALDIYNERRFLK